MRKFKCILSVILFSLLANRCDLQALNDRVPIEVSKCTQFKKNVFETVTTVGSFSYGSNDRPITTDNCKSFAPFIVNGTPAKSKEFPHIARLGTASPQQREVKWFCGGTLISVKYVLTAAHCLYSKHGEVNRVRLGELDFSTSSDDAQPEDFNVLNYIPYPDYNWRSSSIYDDIGLIELDRYVVFNHYKHPACLPSGFNDDAFSTFVAIGWGSTKFAAAGSQHLLKVSLDRFSYDACRQHTDYPGNDRLALGLDSRSQLCAGSADTKDTCNGDSGGPLLAYHPDYSCMYIVVGITSNGISGCGYPNVPGIYTRVHNYLNWINAIVWQ